MKRLLPVITFAILVVVPAIAGSPQTPSTSPQAAKTIAPGSTLVVEGIPEVPASLASEVKRYTESRSAGLADWHPTRRELLITTRFGTTDGGGTGAGFGATTACAGAAGFVGSVCSVWSSFATGGCRVARSTSVATTTAAPITTNARSRAKPLMCL